MNTATPRFLPQLNEYLDVAESKCKACLDKIELSTTECQIPEALNSHLALYYVKFNTDNEPKFDALVRVLTQHIVRFSLSHDTRERLRNDVDDADEADLYFYARSFFRRIKDSGECGEMLLYLMIEAFYRAPQMVCKMELKTNARDEVKGADGVHMRWDSDKNRLDVLLGESKLNGGKIGLYNAMNGAFESWEKFYREKSRRNEIEVATVKIKHANSPLRDEIRQYLFDENKASYHVTHISLIGYDWSHYEEIYSSPTNFANEFKAKYKEELSRYKDNLKRRFKMSRIAHFHHDFIILPFESVQSFRDAFYDRIGIRS